MRLVQVNRQPYFGGGEVYTAFLCRALARLGVATTLLVHPRAAYWRELDLPDDTTLLPVADLTAAALPPGPGWLLSHGPLPPEIVAAARSQGWLVTAVAHMPVQGRDPRPFAGHDRIFAVSGWVLAGLRQAGLPAWPEPLYGVADLQRSRAAAGDIRRTSRYDWDKRKFRDRLLGWLEPAYEALRPHPRFVRRPGLTLGVVSRLTPIKQFPRLFSHLAPILARHADVNLEIYGSGGYASIRDLDRELAPLVGRVRFWGQQTDVRSVYGQIDYLLAGLPEKEALGLNIIEAQACDTPVLAVRAPPFTETVAEGRTGFFYDDPRADDAADFAALLSRLQSLPRLHPSDATDHLARFSAAALVERLRPVVEWAAGADGIRTGRASLVPSR